MGGLLIGSFAVTGNCWLNVFYRICVFVDKFYLFSTFFFCKRNSVLFLSFFIVHNVSAIITWRQKHTCLWFRLVTLFFYAKWHVDPWSHLDWLYLMRLVIRIVFLAVLHLAYEQETLSWSLLSSLFAHIDLLITSVRVFVLVFDRKMFFDFFIVKIKHKLLIKRVINKLFISKWLYSG